MIDQLLSSQEAIDLENHYGAHNYHPLPVVLSKGEGVHLWDLEGRRYYDFLSAYSAVNQGHCHPRIVSALIEQAKQLTLTSRAFYNDKLGLTEKYFCDYFGFDRALLMNSGAEGNETAIKLARKWGYRIKEIPENHAVIIAARENFHGRTTTIISASTDPLATRDFGPFMPGFEVIPFDDVEALDKQLRNPNVAAFWVEPIQGEAGVNVPKEGYLRQVSDLCQEHNVLLILDEVQTGVGRTGHRLACDAEEVQPDILVLGKAISGGVLPVSAVLACDEVMDLLRPGEHGSTFGGNPLACAVAMEALQVVKDEKLTENAALLGDVFRKRMRHLIQKSELVQIVRGMGLLNAIVINDSPESETAWHLCLALKDNGLLAKPTHGNIIRFAPPLVITEEQIHECCDIIERTFLDY